MQISSLPTFRKLQIEDKSLVDDFTSKFPPYCDFQFWPMWHRNIEDDWEIAYFHRHLLIKNKDHITGKDTFTIIGSNKYTGEIIKLFMAYLSNQLPVPTLSLVPQETVNAINLIVKQELVITEDINNNDYIFDVNDLCNLEGSKYKNKRKEIKSYWQKHAGSLICKLDLNDEGVRYRMAKVLDVWSSQASDSKHKREIATVRKVLETKENRSDLDIIGASDGDMLVGFTVNQRFNDDWYIGYFGKADRNYDGVYAVLEHETAKYYQKMKCKYANLEQDLGLSGLRLNKTLWRPSHFLKKYTIQRKQDVDNTKI